MYTHRRERKTLQRQKRKLEKAQWAVDLYPFIKPLSPSLTYSEENLLFLLQTLQSHDKFMVAVSSVLKRKSSPGNRGNDTSRKKLGFFISILFLGCIIVEWWKFLLSNNANVVIKSIHNNPFAIEVYDSKDIVSRNIKGIGWEMYSVVTLKNIYLEYSAKHNIPLSELTFLDIGANIGWFTLNMAALGVNVIAFEPMEQNYEMIKRSLSQKINMDSGISDRVKLYEHGLGVKEEICYLYSDDRNVGDGHIKCVEHENKLSIKQGYSIRQKVIVKRLDDVLTTKEVKSMNIIAAKLDCEGFEGNVLEGGMNVLLNGGILNILSEYQPEWIKEKGSGNGGDPDLFVQRFKDAGFRVVKEGNGEIFFQK